MNLSSSNPASPHAGATEAPGTDAPRIVPAGNRFDHQVTEELKKLREDEQRTGGLDPLLVGIAVMAAGILALDVFTPRGSGIGALYILLIPMAMATRRSSVALAWATVSTALVWVGWYFSPEGAASAYTIPSRSISCLVIWTTAIIGIRSVRAQRAIESLSTSNRWLMSQVDQRVRNSLDTLEAICERGVSDDTNPLLAVERVRRRVRTLVSIHNMLARGKWGPGPSTRMVELCLPEDMIRRVHVTGNQPMIPPELLEPFGLVLGEIAYAVSERRAQQDPAWSAWLEVTMEEHPTEPGLRLRMSWREPAVPGNLPPVLPPSVLHLVDEITARELGLKGAYEEGPSGMSYELCVMVGPRT